MVETLTPSCSPRRRTDGTRSPGRNTPCSIKPAILAETLRYRNGCASCSMQLLWYQIGGAASVLHHGYRISWNCHDSYRTDLAEWNLHPLGRGAHPCAVPCGQLLERRV